MRFAWTTALVVSAATLAAAGASAQLALAPPQSNGGPQQQPTQQNWNPYPQGEVPDLTSFSPLFPQGRSNKASWQCSNAGPARDDPTAKGHPKVVATFPAKGAVVRPGLVVVRITFDQPMSCDASFDGPTSLPNPCPGRWRELTLSKDSHSFRAVCEVKAATRYELPIRSFQNRRGLTQPYDLTFSTSGASPIASVKQALAEDTGMPPTAGG